MAEKLGFSTWENPSSIERFSHFLRATLNEDFQIIRLFFVYQIIEEKVIIGKAIAMASCAIEANTLENNLKTSVKTRFDKDHRPSGYPEVRLAVKVNISQTHWAVQPMFSHPSQLQE